MAKCINVLYSCIFGILVNSFKEYKCEFVFTSSTVNSVSLVVPKNHENRHLLSITNEGLFLPIITDTLEKRQQLCQKARNSLSLPFMSHNKYIFEERQYKVEYPNGKSSVLYAIRCPTYPITHVFADDGKFDGPNIKVVALFVQPKNYRFDVELVNGIKSEYSSIKKHQLDNYLSKLKLDDRFYLCFVSSTRLRCKISFSTPFIREAQTSLFNEEYDGKEESISYPVIDCKTEPAMYLRLKTVEDNIEIKIMLPQSESTQNC